MFTDFRVNRVPRTANTGAKESAKGSEMLVEILCVVSVWLFHRLLLDAVEIARDAFLVTLDWNGASTVPASARSLDDYLGHV
jgi:hypothetical protein